MPAMTMWFSRPLASALKSHLQLALLACAVEYLDRVCHVFVCGKLVGAGIAPCRVQAVCRMLLEAVCS